MQSNPLDVGREMSVDVDVHSNSRHYRPSKSPHSASRHPSPYDNYLVCSQKHLRVTVLTATADNDGSRDMREVGGAMSAVEIGTCRGLKR